MKSIKFIIIGLLSIFIVACCPSCGDIHTQSANKALATEGELSNNVVGEFTNIDENSYGREQMFTEMSQSNFNKSQPPKQLEWSLERQQLNDRNLRWNDPNKVSYIYLLSDMGTIIAYFPIKGKVSSVNSKLTTNMQLVRNYSASSVSGVVESPSMDGSYGSNGDAVFFFLSDGTYMEWAGKYLLCDNYIRLTQKPVLTYDVKE